MALHIRRIDYFHTTVQDHPGEACRLLSRLAAGDVNLLGFAAVPVGPGQARLTVFPDNSEKLARTAEREGFALDGPHPAILVQGDDKLGALADIHSRLSEARINVFASTGVTDGKRGFGYVLYLRPENIDAAVHALGA